MLAVLFVALPFITYTVVAAGIAAGCAAHSKRRQKKAKKRSLHREQALLDQTRPSRTRRTSTRTFRSDLDFYSTA